MQGKSAPKIFYDADKFWNKLLPGKFALFFSFPDFYELQCL